ncbi:signal peptidase I [Micromonospora sp. WMMD1102]|uniref:signal peptidase I n=1 Tax=Micromonospora sp. WMMD1102 TaxID=3016105 RepID=UPI0024157677|nr:signal peptidase I [Micromonospora sp. WMMD1102]MDG4789185.1 signal peptidase I [Micromonospora sp. WMMD1102]
MRTLATADAADAASADAADAAVREPRLRRIARAVLTRAVHGRAEVAPGDARGVRSGAAGTWGAAILGEFDETSGSWEAVRWAASGVWLSWRERRPGRRLFVQVAAVLWPDNRRRRLLVAGSAAALLGVLLGQFLLAVRYVPSISMEPTLQVGDRVVADRWLVRLTGADRGDLVLLRVPDQPAGRVDGRALSDGKPETFVVRVLGLPGDQMSCVDGHLWRNGAPVDEPYLAAGSRTDCRPVTVPPDGVYLLGDHREGAADSRIWGPVDADDVVGRVFLRTWPVTRVGPVH